MKIVNSTCFLRYIAVQYILVYNFLVLGVMWTVIYIDIFSSGLPVYHFINPLDFASGNLLWIREGMIAGPYFYKFIRKITKNIMQLYSKYDTVEFISRIVDDYVILILLIVYIWVITKFTGISIKEQIVI